MNLRLIFIGVSAVIPLLLSGCANQSPVPVLERGQGLVVAERPAVPVEIPPGHYMVKKGDTLIRVSLDNGQDYRDVAAWNNLEDPNKINVGQVLRVIPPEGVAVAKPVTPPPSVESRTPGAVAGTGVKQEPKGGVQPYSEETLARLKQAGSAPLEPKPQLALQSPPLQEKPAVPVAMVEGDWAWPGSGKILAPFSEANNKGLDLVGKVGDPVQAAAAGKVVYVGTGLRGYGNLVIIKHDSAYLSAYAHNSKILVKEGQAITKGMKIAEVGSSDTDQPKLHFEIRKQGKPVDPLAYLPKR